MADQEIELTEKQMHDLAAFCLKTGLDPTDRDFMDHINGCDCVSCNGAKVLIFLVGDRVKAMIEAEMPPDAKWN